MKRLSQRNFANSASAPCAKFKGEALEDEGYRIDLLVEQSVVVELKTVPQLLPIHESQLLTYLRLSQKSLGLLINFNVPLLKDGIKRLVHNFPSE